MSALVSAYRYHRSCPINPHIAGTFYRAGYVENWGRDIRTMADECKRHGNKPPEFTVGDGDFIVKFPELEFIPGRDDYDKRNPTIKPSCPNEKGRYLHC